MNFKIQQKYIKKTTTTTTTEMDVQMYCQASISRIPLLNIDIHICERRRKEKSTIKIYTFK